MGFRWAAGLSPAHVAANGYYLGLYKTERMQPASLRPPDSTRDLNFEFSKSEQAPRRPMPPTTRRRRRPSPAAELAACGTSVPHSRRLGMDGAQAQGTAVAGLLDDVMVDILSRVPVKDIHRSKCVSKPWGDLIAHPIHRKRLPQTLEGFFHGGGPGGGWRHSYGQFSSLSGSGRVPPGVDPSFAFLTAKLPGLEHTVLLDSCNGVLLFGCRREDKFWYVVCNPATQELVTVPASSDDSCPPLSPFEERDVRDEKGRYAHTYLMFDPAFSSRFSLVQFWDSRWQGEVDAVYSYSSETRTWSDRSSTWKCGKQGLRGKSTVKHTFGKAMVNGLLHFIVCRAGRRDKNLIVAVDGEGKICRIIPWNDQRVELSGFLGESQGHLHCIANVQYEHNGLHLMQLSDFVLEDYDTQNWILKHSVSSLQLFGSLSGEMNNYELVAIHPDHNSIILVQHWNQELVSFDLDRKELRVLCALAQGYRVLTPYVPCFMESQVFLPHRTEVGACEMLL